MKSDSLRRVIKSITPNCSGAPPNHLFMKKLLLIILPGLIFLSAGFGITASQNNPITLHDEKLSFTPRKFYIASVADGRLNRATTAFLIDNNKKTVQVDLKNGAVTAIKKFLARNLHRDTTRRPVMLTIREFKLSETALPNAMVKGILTVNFSYSSQLSYQTKHLTDYVGQIRYQRAAGKSANVEAVLRQGIENGLTYFNNWINKQNTF